MGYNLKKPLFPLGEILASPELICLGINYHPLIRRHQSGDWGDLCADDILANNEALARQEAILSQYDVAGPSGHPLIVIVMTEDDRSQTVVFLESFKSHSSD